LLRLSELPSLLATTPVRSELVYELVRLDKEYASSSPSTSWPEYYARALAGRFGNA